MARSRGLLVAVALVCGGCAGLRSKDAVFRPEARVIQLVQADAAPIIDGRLDDACWQCTQALTGFQLYHSERLAVNQSSGYVTYDDTHLYIGMKCLLSPGAKPAGKLRPHDANVFSDDIVEIMVDPGRTGADYYQLVINAYGATFDCARRHGGRDEDDAWNGDWQGQAFIGDGFWSAEIALPFHNLGLQPGVGTTWGLNLCREAKNPDELSSIGVEGEFNRAGSFGAFRGLDVDFSRYFIQVGAESLETEPGPTGPVAKLVTSVRNLARTAQDVRIDRCRATPEGKEEVETVTALLQKGEPLRLVLDTMEIAPTGEGAAKCLFALKTPPRTRRIVVASAADGTVYATSVVRALRPVWQAMRMHVHDPWSPQTGRGRTRAIRVDISTDFAAEHLRGRTLTVDLVAPDGKVLTGVLVPAPRQEEHVTLDTRALPGGAYRVRAALLEDRGGLRVSGGWEAEAPTVVLPGGKQYVKVLNNFVSELMNTRERGLAGERQVGFMNPRDGWCFFALSGAGSVWLGAEAAPLLSGHTGADPVEAMRYLPAGLHALRLDGAPENLIVRAVPALQHAFYNADPHIHPYGPYDWEFLAKDVQPNVNVMVSGSEPAPEHIQPWRESGRGWIGITNIVIPDFDAAAPDAVEKTARHWSGSIGFKHPLMQGVIVDEFGGGDDPAYDVYRKAVEKLRTEFPDRIYMPYGGSFFAPDRSREFARAALLGGGYVCPEHYLPEQRTEADARRLIEEQLTAPLPLWERGLPGSVRRMIVVLGYMSQPTESLNVDPTVDFKVYMDMQVRALATHPDGFGLGGLQEYHSSYCDEENVRWAGRLYRHYCIEGRTEPLTRDPYKLSHIQNPDFEDGTAGWTVQEAEPGSVKPLSFGGYSHLEGRYPRTSQGDTFLCLKRSTKAPNVFAQEIRGLEPGRLYSLKMISADYQALVQEKSSKAMDAVSIRLDGVAVLPGVKNSFQFTFPNNYAHKLGKFDAKYPYWMNYHWRVFRATAKSARLTVSDWAGEKDPGGPIGQELVFNFIEIQPYVGE